MTREYNSQPDAPASGQDRFVSHRDLAHRLQDELAFLAHLAQQIQFALGTALCDMTTIPADVQRNLQAIDLLYQTLTELSSVMDYLANHVSDGEIPAASLNRVIRLQHLAENLLDGHDRQARVAEDASGSISWL